MQPECAVKFLSKRKTTHSQEDQVFILVFEYSSVCLNASEVRIHSVHITIEGHFLTITLIYICISRFHYIPDSSIWNVFAKTDNEAPEHLNTTFNLVRTSVHPSSETQGLLVGTMRYFRASDVFGAKVYFKGWRALGHFFLPTEFQKCRNPFRSSWVILSSSIEREDSLEEFQKKKELTKPGKSQTITWELAILVHQFFRRIYRRYIVKLTSRVFFLKIE